MPTPEDRGLCSSCGNDLVDAAGCRQPGCPALAHWRRLSGPGGGQEGGDPRSALADQQRRQEGAQRAPSTDAGLLCAELAAGARQLRRLCEEGQVLDDQAREDARYTAVLIRKVLAPG